MRSRRNRLDARSTLEGEPILHLALRLGPFHHNAVPTASGYFYGMWQYLHYYSSTRKPAGQLNEPQRRFTAGEGAVDSKTWKTRDQGNLRTV